MTSRDLTAGMLTAIAAGTVRPAIFYEGEFASADTSTSRALLHLDGADGAATFTDEYGNTFARVGALALSTTYAKFGAASLLSGEANEYIKTTEIVPNSAAWTLEAWVRWSPLPTDGFLNSIFSIQNAGGYGFQLSTYRTATALTFRHWLSTNGTSWNVMDNVDAAAGTVAADTWYHIAATYDPDTATIYTYLDGVKIKEQAAVAVNACTEVQIGATAASIRSIGGYLDEFRLSDVCRYPGGATFTPSVATFGMDSQYLRLFTGIGTIDWNGYTWTGGADLLSFSPIKEAADVQAVGFSVTISGLPSAKIDLALTKIRQGLPGKLWLGLFNDISTITTTFDSSAKAAAVVYSNGNLTATCDGTSSLNSALGNVSRASGKFYYEVTVDVLSSFGVVGIGTASMSVANGNRVGFDVYGIGYKSTATCDNDGAFPAYGTAWSQGDVLSVLVDLDTQALSFWRNGVDLGAAPFSPTAGLAYMPAVSVHEYTSLTANFGDSEFVYTPPAGYVGWTLTRADALIADPYMLRRGKFDIAVIDRSGDTCTIQAQYEDRLIDLERPRARRYTSADQQRDYPADLGFDYVPSLQDMEIVWR